MSRCVEFKNDARPIKSNNARTVMDVYENIESTTGVDISCVIHVFSDKRVIYGMFR